MISIFQNFSGFRLGLKSDLVRWTFLSRARRKYSRVYRIKKIFLLFSRVSPLFSKIDQGNDYFYLVKQFLESYP